MSPVDAKLASISAWQAVGVDIVVSLLTPEEQAELGQDCYCHVQQTEYDAERKVHVVTLRSLT